MFSEGRATKLLETLNIINTKIFIQTKSFLTVHIYLVSQRVEWYIVRRYHKTNLDTPHLLYIVGWSSKVSERFHLQETKLFMAKEVLEM